MTLCEGSSRIQTYLQRRIHAWIFFAGDDLRRSDGKWMQKKRVLDRDNDRYIEVVVDPETEEIVHEKDEPLSEHVDHGTAKFKK